LVAVAVVAVMLFGAFPEGEVFLAETVTATKLARL